MLEVLKSVSRILGGSRRVSRIFWVSRRGFRKLGVSRKKYGIICGFKEGIYEFQGWDLEC